MKKVLNELHKQERTGIHPKYTDVFMAHELRNAKFSFPYNFPLFKTVNEIPIKLIPFDRINTAKGDDFNSYVHFYLQDIQFERFWKNPKQYIAQLKKFKGCILPDFSLCYDFPYPLQLFNCYKNRVLGYILTSHDIPVIMNVSFGDSRTFDFCCNGISKGGLIATGSLGTMKNKLDRNHFLYGLETVLKEIRPSKLLLYGATTTEVKTICASLSVELHVFTPIWDASFITKEADIYG